MKHAKKNSNIILKMVICFIIIIILIGVMVGKIISGKLSNLTIKEINQDDLEINDEIYNTVSDTLTKSEYDGVRNIVLLGSDSESIGDPPQGRSDTIMIVSINPKYKSLKMISIPRDTYVDIPGYEKNKINHAYAWGKEQLALKTINMNFGMNLTEYISIDFSGIIHIINDIGGIDLYISKQEMEFINMESKYAYRTSGNKQEILTSYGTINLDGEQALTHSRNRTIGDDFTRASRQRDVIEAILNKMSKMDMGQISSMLDLFLKEVTTNINVADYIGTITEILLYKNAYLGNIVSEQVPSKDYAEGEYIKGIYYFVPSDTERMKEDMINYLYKR